MSKVIIQTIKADQDLALFLEHFNLGKDGVLIKPNWTSGDYGFYTDPRTLELLLAAIPGKKYVLESYMWGRTGQAIKITATNAKANWEYLRQQDAYFLKQTGM